MKKILILVLLLFLPKITIAQTQGYVIKQFRDIVGEPRNTGEVTDSIAWQWLNLALREFANYGVNVRETSYVAAAGRDSFSLPIDFIRPQWVRKTIASRAHDIDLSDSTSSTYVRTDTLILSATKPDNPLSGDVVDIVAAYKKENPLTGKIKSLTRVPPESLYLVAGTPQSYYFFLPQPFPTMTMGQKASFSDTAYVIVNAIVPKYILSDTGKSNLQRGWLRLVPPPVRADTVKMTYIAEMDTMVRADTALYPISVLSNNIRPALPKYMAEKYYKKHGFTADGLDYEKQWMGLLISNAIMKGIKVAIPR